MPYRRDHNFEDPDFYQAKVATKQRFTKVLFDLQETAKKNGYAVQTIQRFRKCLNNPENGDISRLPFYSNTALSKKCNKITCVLSLISFIIQKYWQFCADDKGTETTISAGLFDLENIVEKGLKAFKLSKSQSPKGYYLKEI